MDGFKGDKGERGDTSNALIPDITIEALTQLNITQLLKGIPCCCGIILELHPVASVADELICLPMFTITHSTALHS